jgi:hypothetical protein
MMFPLPHSHIRHVDISPLSTIVSDVSFFVQYRCSLFRPKRILRTV